MRVTAEQVHEHETHKFVAEASTLRLARFPSQLETDLGNKMPFILHRIDDDGTALYRQANGCISLTVFND